MRTVSVSEARNHLGRLLDEVARGETITITRRGVRVARLAPAGEPNRMSVGEAIAGLKGFREGHTLGGVTIRELIEEGRRF